MATMSMKKTDLDKLKGKKLASGGGTPDRYGKGSAAHGKQRKGGKFAGGVPLALKLLGKAPADK